MIIDYAKTAWVILVIIVGGIIWLFGRLGIVVFDMMLRWGRAICDYGWTR
jgi:multisubunit Na+/H+ antiporter MnhG subunit